MAYDANIPQPNDQLKDSQADLLANFQAIKALIDINHDTFGSPTEGKHKFVSFPVQTPVPTFSAGEDGLYNRLYAVTNKNELFSHIQTFAGTSNIPSTASILGQATPGASTNGWTYLPSGILMHWGLFSGNGSATVTVDASFAPFTAIFTVILCPVNPAVGDVDFAVRLVDIISPTQFTAYFSSRTTVGAAAGSAKALIIGR